MNWEERWELDKYEVGRAMHEGWKRQKIANGFAGHPIDRRMDPPFGCMLCDKAERLHHEDMIDWDELPPGQQAINYEGGREGYRLGFTAGFASAITAATRDES